ncbi:MAG: hypothetical protein NC177_15610 [Ruminococcus flavefaciens]|nr:hypothetical protein [Ruminococcus flavefaciens]
MKKDGKYRFSLQFGSGTEKEINAGELLEKLGNKKSVIVVEALNDYLIAHPNLMIPNCRIEVKLESGYNRIGIEEIVRTIVEQQLKLHHTENGSVNSTEEQAVDVLENDVLQMLDNLDMFQ